jgi:hypothetical protein
MMHIPASLIHSRHLKQMSVQPHKSFVSPACCLLQKTPSVNYQLPFTHVSCPSPSRLAAWLRICRAGSILSNCKLWPCTACSA